MPFHFRRAQCGGSPEETNERAQGYGSVCLRASFFLISVAPVSAWAPAGQVMAVPAGASSSDGQRFISPQLVIYGTAKQRKAGVRGTGLPELVHCPAPSCFTTQQAGLPNLRWQTVTYITPRLANEDWWCLKRSVYTVDFSHVLLLAQHCTKEYCFSFLPPLTI